jgi:hypothetical protein
VIKRDTVTIPVSDLAGSKLRCLILTSLPDKQVANVLSSLVSPLATVDAGRHHWMPGGFLNPEEAKLGECEAFLTPPIRDDLTSWWLKVRRGANTPNWDIVSTCTVDRREGLILVEAKAHDTESKLEGKKRASTPNGEKNHEQIGAAIREADIELNSICPGWAITRDSHYQLCNRFAWAWKIASLGVPVILIYLGFLRAEEMVRCGTPLHSEREWRALVLEHGKNLVPESVWESRLQTRGAPMWTMIRSLDLCWVSARASA